MKIRFTLAEKSTFVLILVLLILTILPVETCASMIALMYILCLIGFNLYLFLKYKMVEKTIVISFMYFLIIAFIYALHWPNYFFFHIVMLVGCILFFLSDLAIGKFSLLAVFNLINFISIFILNIPSSFGRLRGVFAYFNEWKRFL